MPRREIPDEANSLQVWKQEVESQGWAINSLCLDLEDVWMLPVEIESQTFDPCGTNFNNTQKSLLCLALLNHSSTTAVGTLNLKPGTGRRDCSVGLFRGLNKLYVSSPKKNPNIRKIKWDNIKIACEVMGYLDFDKNVCLEIIEAVKQGYLITIENAPEQIIKLIKKIRPK